MERRRLFSHGGLQQEQGPSTDTVVFRLKLADENRYESQKYISIHLANHWR